MYFDLIHPLPLLLDTSFSQHASFLLLCLFKKITH